MRLQFDCEVAAARDEVFRFHADERNLSALMDGLGGFRLLRHEPALVDGAVTVCEQQIAGFRFEMEFRHRDVTPPASFTDDMVRGPFARFVHVHEFDSTPRGTIVRDRIDVALPWTLGGEFATRCLVAPFLERTFRIRHAQLRRWFGATAP